MAIKTRLFILKLPESPIVTEPDGTANYERFDMSWILVVKKRGGTRLHPLLPDECNREEEVGEETSIIREGDAIFFPELLTGAGEFEGFRFVGEQLQDDELRLLSGGIEFPEFPCEIVQLIQNNNNITLRTAYEHIFNQMISTSSGCLSNMDDVIGGSADDYWASPNIQRQNERRLTEVKEWKIPLNECQILGGGLSE
jgi:hypothetical protein